MRLELSSEGRYAIRALLYLAATGERVPASRIARETDIPPRLLARILADLARERQYAVPLGRRRVGRHLHERDAVLERNFDRIKQRTARRLCSVREIGVPVLTRILHADKGYDSDAIRRQVEASGTMPNIPPKANRRWKNCFSPVLYRDRNAIERMFCRLKDFRRVATRYDKRADVFLAGILLAAAITWWLN